jgi:hypothetical protein
LCYVRSIILMGALAFIGIASASATFFVPSREGKIFAGILAAICLFMIIAFAGTYYYYTVINPVPEAPGNPLDL